MEETLALQSKLISVLSSNVQSTLNTVPVEHRTSGLLPFDATDKGRTKVLSLQWLPTEDVFQCALSLNSLPVYTKRGVLSCIARIFDSLGFFGPAIFTAKHIMQRTWVANLSWDITLPDDIHHDWPIFYVELSMLTSLWLTIPHGSFKVYISNRVHQFSTLMHTCRWFHVASAQNSADCASRGIIPSELADLSLYWSGSKFIRDKPSDWDDGTPLVPKN